jgi:hypothetical protein
MLQHSTIHESIATEHTQPATAQANGVARRGRLLAAGGAGLSQRHISPQGLLPSVTYSCGGSRIQISIPTGQAPDSTSKRGEITGFTAKSRRRLLDLLNRTHSDAIPLFVTLTYPASWPERPAEWKRHLDVFAKSLARVGRGRLSAVWKLEPQRRGAPHFHLLVWGVRHLHRFRDWLSAVWYRIVDSGDERHLRAGTQAAQVKSRRGVMWYASKYMSKAVAAAGWVNPGRFWGVLNRDALPLADDVTMEVPVWLAHRLKRWLRRATGWGYVSHTGQTFYISDSLGWLARLGQMAALGP